MFDTQKFIDGVHDYIGKALAPIRQAVDEIRSEMGKSFEERWADAWEKMQAQGEKLAEIEARQPVRGEKGEDGKDAPTLEEILPPLLEATRGLVDPIAAEIREAGSALSEELTRQVGEAIELIPVLVQPADGKSVSLEEVLPALQAQVAEVIEPMQAAAAQKATDLESEFRGMVEAAIAAIPTPKDGEDGKSVSVDEVLQALMPSVNARMAEWEVQAERRFFDFCQRAIAQMPKPKDGKDALGIENADLEFDGKRTYTLIFRNEDREIRKSVSIPAVIDVGFWKPGLIAEKGDGVTQAGSYWIAQETTESAPEIGNPAWRLAVRKGRDARMVEMPKREPKPVKLGSAQ